MKTRQLLLAFLFLVSTIVTFAQASFTSAGIAVQGIARDINNTAFQNQTITLEFEFYYFDDSNAIKPIGSVISKQVLTDNFGVFSTIIDPNFANNQQFSNYKVWLRIKKNGDTSYMSEAPLNHVPYAIAANNGVPTGCIMPFVGASNQVPVGWALCDGKPLPAEAKALIALLGSINSPNLGGMFLRGAGTNTNGGIFAGNDGPAVNQKQDDAIISHTPIVTDPKHGHGIVDPKHAHKSNIGQWYDGGINGSVGGGGTSSRGYASVDNESKETGITVNLNTTGITVKYVGGTETRPVNYGVNYIIKL